MARIGSSYGTSQFVMTQGIYEGISVEAIILIRTKSVKNKETEGNVPSAVIYHG